MAIIFLGLMIVARIIAVGMNVIDEFERLLPMVVILLIISVIFDYIKFSFWLNN